jgi:FKBP-type peptidyl-prolyl cis-trans isomerase
MKNKLLVLTSALCVSAALVACKHTEDSANVTLDTTVQKFSYGMGLQIGKMAYQQEVDLDLQAYRAGLTDGMSNAEQRVTNEELQSVFAEQQKSVAEKAERKREETSSKNQKEGGEFLEANKAKEGVTVTKSGLQYKVITEGEGAKAKVTDKVKVHYKGTLIDGTEFDSSYKRGNPVEFPLSGVIKGWQEGLQLMSKGAKYELYIPSDLAYGKGGAGNIGPDAVLIFEVELIDITDVKAEKKAK